MIVIAIGDLHLCGKNPIARIDDLTITQYEKLEEIVDLANKKSAPIVSVGDIFHTSIVADSLKTELGGILNKLKQPFYFCWGNHDLLYHSLKIWKRTSLGVMLQNNRMIKHISSFEEDYDVDWDYIDWDAPLKQNGSKFLLAHKAIINNKQMKSNFWIEKDKSFALPVGQWSEDYKLILCGHWHKQYSFKHKSTTIINPGPVSRINVEDNLHPSVCLVNLKTGMFNRYPLQSAKPFEDVISSKHIIRKENNNDNIKKFISAVGKKGSQYDSSFMDCLMNLVDNHELDEEMEELLKDILAKSKERRK